jgi:hypothetical protein
MESHDGTHVGMGGTLLGLGGAGMVALLIYAAERVANKDSSAWGLVWFLTVFAISALMAISGAYVLSAVYLLALPLPKTRSERKFRPNLRFVEAHLVSLREIMVFQIGVQNAGRGNVPEALLNVVVPEFIAELHRCTEAGEIGRQEHRGEYSHTPESLIPDQPDVRSIYWNGNVSFPGRTHRIVYLRATMNEVRDFPVRLEITSPELDEPLEKHFEITGLAATQLEDSPASEQALATDEQAS